MTQPRQASRRDFLRQALHGAAGTATLAATGGLLPAPAVAAEPPAQAAWRNWSGNQSANPSAVLYPRNEAELVQAVKTGKGPVRAVGGSHSFAPVVPTEGTLVSLEAMSGLLAHDKAALTATLGGGTRIAMAGELLAGIGQSLVNEPDINLQSLAGAISTATHGTGLALKCLSGYVTELKLVLADGSVATCSAQKDRELFDAARVGVGSIGIISEVTFANAAAYKLREETQVMDIAAAMALVDKQRHVDRHVEFFAFPYGGKAIVHRMNTTTEADTPVADDSADQNQLLELAADTVAFAPFTKGVIQKLVGAFVEESTRVAPSHRMFPNVRTVQFNEMEYTVPADRGLACLEEVMAAMREGDFGVFFPIEFRYTAADDCWLSPFQGRAGASISIHQYAKQDYRPLFAALEPIVKRYEGRPHWGKLHTLTAADLRTRYPRWDDFLAVRRRVDPQGRFLTPYMRSLFGV